MILNYLKIYLFSLIMLVLTGCTSTNNPDDPFESYNRKVSKFNDALDTVILKPVAITYKTITPKFIRKGVNNFFNNIMDLGSSFNFLVQGRITKSYTQFVRFGTNTFLGLGGLIDVASLVGDLEREKQDFGQVLAYWGYPSGPYLVLPFLGPSTIRDTFALPVDWYPMLSYMPNEKYIIGFASAYFINLRTELLDVTDTLDVIALDKYQFTRDFYLKQRRTYKADIEKYNQNEDDGYIEFYEDE